MMAFGLWYFGFWSLVRLEGWLLVLFPHADRRGLIDFGEAGLFWSVGKPGLGSLEFAFEGWLAGCWLLVFGILAFGLWYLLVVGCWSRTRDRRGVGGFCYIWLYGYGMYVLEGWLIRWTGMALALWPYMVLWLYVLWLYGLMVFWLYGLCVFGMYAIYGFCMSMCFDRYS